MRAIRLYTEPLNFNMILTCEMNKTVNRHFLIQITGYVTESVDEVVKVLNETNRLIVYAEESGERKSFFRGDICRYHIQEEGKMRMLTITAESSTSHLESGVHVRAFQNPDYTYYDIVEFIKKKNKRTSVIYNAGKNITTGGLVIQYNETDWDFLVRLAARAHTVLVPDCTNDLCCFYFGIPQMREKVTIESNNFEVSVIYPQDGSQKKIIEYHLHSREIWDLCTPMMIQGKEFLVYSIQGKMICGELVWEYQLRKAEDFQASEIWNKNLIGASLFGYVLGVERDMVRLRIECEDDFSDGKDLWFPYATVYASSDGNGWYFMPDQGVKVRLCFPDKDENNAYVASAVYLEDEPGKKNNPEIKFIRTAWGKEIRFAPEYILITNHKGMSIRLDDEEGIEIRSAGNIELISGDGMELISKGDLTLNSSSGVVLRNEENSIVIREGVRVNGLKVRFQ